MATFASRVSYFPLNVEEDVNVFEREYLLGGKGTDTTAKSHNNNNKNEASGKLQMDFFLDDPLPAEYNVKIAWFSNITSLILGIGLVIVCAVEGKDSRNADENCPLLSIGIALGVVVLLNSLLGLVGIAKRKHDYGAVTLNANVAVTQLVILFSVLFAIAVLIHWDFSGQPAHQLFFPIETVGVRHRYLIWGTALLISLSSVAFLYGVLGLANQAIWSGHDSVFSWTLYSSCVLMMLAGLSMGIAGIAVWFTGEMKALPHPVWMIGSMVTGVALFVVGVTGLQIKKKEHIDYFLIWLPLVSACVILFSIGNAATGETDDLTQRRTLTLFSSLVGLWGQVSSIVAIIAASNWRHNMKISALTR